MDTTMKKTNIAKLATTFVVGGGVHHVTNGIVNNNVDFDGLNSFGKFTVFAARAVVSSMAAAKTKEYTDARIDEIVDAFQKASNQDTPFNA